MSDHGDFASHCQTCKREGARRQSLCGSLREDLWGMTTRRDQLREDAQFRIMRLLHDNPEMSQRELARAVGVSTGGIHYVLSALLDKGLIKLGNFAASDDRRRYAYVLTRKGVTEKAALTKRFLARKMAEYEALRAEIEAVRAEVDAGGALGDKAG
ncbi:MarR family EPS-associated transcriptional regulator [Roseovarius ramblicola]|uniref:MarR family EPS-associated transcriptional regulator n=1 Tax=Roseovarius ramblicola TaxID=2022336 RepID=UPI0036723CB2